MYIAGYKVKYIAKLWPHAPPLFKWLPDDSKPFHSHLNLFLAIVFLLPAIFSIQFCYLYFTHCLLLGSKICRSVQKARSSCQKLLATTYTHTHALAVWHVAELERVHTQLFDFVYTFVWLKLKFILHLHLILNSYRQHVYSKNN